MICLESDGGEGSLLTKPVIDPPYPSRPKFASPDQRDPQLLDPQLHFHRRARTDTVPMPYSATRHRQRPTGRRRWYRTWSSRAIAFIQPPCPEEEHEKDLRSTQGRRGSTKDMINHLACDCR